MNIKLNMIDTKRIKEKFSRPDLSQEDFEQKCYELYQLEWMMSHGYSLDDLYTVMLKYEKHMFDPQDFMKDGDETTFNFDTSDLERSAEQARDILFQEGFGFSHIFSHKCDFLKNEYLDASYMKRLFETQTDNEADKLNKMYTLYTGNDITSLCDLTVSTNAGELRAYKTPYNSYFSGIQISFQPTGYDKEIPVALAYEEDLNVNVNLYGKSSNIGARYTHHEVIKRSCIEKELGHNYLSQEELKKIIVNEWKGSTYYDHEYNPADKKNKIPQYLLDEIVYRCGGLENGDITKKIRACLKYVKEHGERALIKENDDCNIWRYIA